MCERADCVGGTGALACEKARRRRVPLQNNHNREDSFYDKQREIEALSVCLPVLV